MAHLSYDLIEKFIHDSSIDEVNSNKTKIEKFKLILKDIVSYELTDRQRQILILYFYKNLKMSEIADELSVNKSTISRTMKRAINKIYKYTKYYSFR